MEDFRPTRRLPFGFHGDWGKLYKHFVDDEKALVNEDKIEYQNCFYVDIGADIQFKKVVGRKDSKDQPIQNYLTSSQDMTIETTDSYWDDTIKGYVCCVSVGDIVFLFGRKWLVERIEEKPLGRYSFYYCYVKSIK